MNTTYKLVSVKEVNNNKRFDADAIKDYNRRLRDNDWSFP